MKFYFDGSVYDIAANAYEYDGFRLPDGRCLLTSWTESIPAALESVALAPCDGHLLDLLPITGIVEEHPARFTNEGSSRRGGVRHEILSSVERCQVREVWYYLDTGMDAFVSEVDMPFVDLVHMVVNSTPEEREILACRREVLPNEQATPRRSPPLMIAWQERLATIILAFLRGPAEVRGPGLAAWKASLIARLKDVLADENITTDGIGYALALSNRLKSDSVLDEPSAVVAELMR